MSSPFDTKLEHLLNNYLSSTGVNHSVRQAFIYEDILTFEVFTACCSLENIKTFQRDDGNNNIVPAFNIAKLTLITNARLYYTFLINNNQEVLAEDPVQWVKCDFRKWKINPTRTATQTTATQKASNTTTTAIRNIVSNKEVVTTDDDIVAVSTATTTPVFSGIESNEDVVLNLDDVAADDDETESSSNLIVTATVVDDDDIDIDNAILSLGCENSIGILNGTQNDYFQLKQNRSSNVAPVDDVEFDNAKFQRSTVPVPVPVPITTSSTTTTVIRTEMVLNEEVIHTKIVSTGKAISNLNTVAAVVDDDNINNAKSPPKCGNPIGDLDGIKNEYYQADEKYCSIYDRSDDDNPPPLPPESPAYAINIECIYSNIPNDGEILSLPLISSVYRVK